MKATTTLRLLVALCIVLLVSTACRRNDTPAATPTTPANTLPTAEVTDATVPAGEATELPDVTPISEPDAPTATPEDPTPEPTAEPVLDADWEPQLVYSSPALGEETALDGAITLRFDQAMDQASVEAAFAIDGDVMGEFVWTRPDTVIFTPQANLQRSATYRVNVAETARGSNGMSLREALALEFETVGFLSVSDIIPNDGADEVTIDSAITVLFNRPVVPLVGTAQQSDLPNPLTITPAVDGTGMWVGTSIYRFEPTQWAGATVYQVTVDAGLTDVVGGVLDESVSAEFTTEPPRILRIFPPESDFIQPTDTVSVTFNMPMDRARTEAAIAIGPVAPVYSWNADSTEVGIRSDLFQLNTNYALAVGQEAAAVGGATLQEGSVFSVNTFPLPAIKFDGTYPRNGETLSEFETPYFGGMGIDFVSPMNWDTLLDQITVEPAPDSIRYNFFGQQSMRLEFQVDYETEYVVTVPSSAEDTFGNQIGVPTVLSFSTSAAPPLSAFNLPGRVVQFSSDFPTDVALTRRNLPAATVLLDRFVGNFPYQTLFTAAADTYFPDGIPIADSDTIETITTYAYEPVDGSASEVLQLGGETALPNGVYNIWMRIPDQPDDVKQQLGWQNRDAMLIVADTNLVLKETPDTVYIWATDIATGQPVVGREITLYSNYPTGGPSSTQPFATVTTDANGLAQARQSE